MEILIGADPELFLFENGKPISAYGVIPGTKHKPFKVNNGAVQVDGMALEFNIDPAKDEESFITNINSVMKTLNDMVCEVDGRSVVASPVAEFGEEYISQQPEDATKLGCDPDFNAWTMQENVKPNGALPFRTAAGHVHIGWTNGEDITSLQHVGRCASLVKQLDFFLGLPSLLYDRDTKRRVMYGKPGCFRPKTYGCEYRVLSNQWLKSDRLKSWVYRNTKMAVDRLVDGDAVWESIDPAILDNLQAEKPNLRQVKKLLNGLNIPLPEAV